MALELMGRRKVNQIDWSGVPLKYFNKVSAVCRSLQDCSDLVRWFGAANFCPFLPILMLIPDHPTLLVGAGYAPASELRDDAENIWGKYTERLRTKGSILDFDALREKNGLLRREDVKAATQEAFWNRIKAHQSSPVTDPPRQPHYPKVNNRTLFPVGDKGQ